jgi:hypothetical protein
MAETEGQHKLRTVALLGIIVGIALIPTGIGAPMIGVSVAALALSTEVARSSLSAGRDAVREETRRAAEHVRKTVTEAVKPRAGETPEHPRWWGRQVLRGAAGAARGVRGLRRAMHRRQPGDPAAIGQKPAGPLRRIRSAVRAGTRRGARRTRQRLGQHGQRLRRERWRGVLPIVAGGLAVPSLRGIRSRWTRRRGRPAPAREPIALGPATAGPALAALPPGDGEPVHRERPERPVLSLPVPEFASEAEWRMANGIPAPAPAQVPAAPAALPAGNAESEAPGLAPAAIANDQPAAIGGSVPTGTNPYAPAMRAPSAPPANGGAATHSEWMTLMARLREAHANAMKNYDSALANLRKVNPGQTHYAECVRYFGACGDYLKRIEAFIGAVDKLEGPIRAATDALGGPKERANSNYHAVY